MNTGEKNKVSLVSHYFNRSSGYGTARYAANLADALNNLGRSVERISCENSMLPAKTVRDFLFNLPLKAMHSKCRLMHILTQQIGFSYPLLKPGRKLVTSILDLTPFKYPGFANAFVSKAAEQAVRNSDRVISISSLTHQDVYERFGVSSEMISLGVEKRFRPLGRQPDKFVIGYIGGFRPSKNPDGLYRILHNISMEHDMATSFDARIYGSPSELRSSGVSLSEVASYRGFAPDSVLPDIYNSFSVFLYPALFDGFSFPILEAQACGVPVVVLKDSKIPPEVTKHCLKADDEHRAAELIFKIRDNGYRQSSEHWEYLKRFDWLECARKTMKVYDEVL